MAKFPTESEVEATIRAPLKRTYAYLWDVLGSSECIAGIESCRETPGEKDTYQFVYEPKSTGPVSLVVRYTARYEGNGKDSIWFESVGGAEDNTEVKGRFQLESAGPQTTRVQFWQMMAPETPVPRLVQGLLRSFVEREVADGMRQFLQNVTGVLEGGK